jgi:hypothetical protein
MRLVHGGKARAGALRGDGDDHVFYFLLDVSFGYSHNLKKILKKARMIYHEQGK